MSLAYYLSDIVGTGQIDNPYRAKAADLVPKSPVATAIHTDPTTGAPPTTGPQSFALVIVGTANHSPLIGAAGIDPLPVVSLDQKVASVSQQSLNTLQAALARRGYLGSIGSQDSFRDVVSAIGTSLNPSFDVNTFSVPDV